MLSKYERLRCVSKTSLLSNHPKRPALMFVRGAHHRRCAREGLTLAMMPYEQEGLQAHLRGDYVLTSILYPQITPIIYDFG